MFIGHGSRDERGNEEIRQFVRNYAQKRSLVHYQTCFLEFGVPNIAEGIRQCVEKGALEIVAIPMILLPAGHSKLHIPAALDAAKEAYPQVKFFYGTPVGSDEKILDILSERLGSVYNKESIKPEETAVLLVGRGSSDPDANSTLFRLARLFWEKHKFQMVETAFMGITQPLLVNGLERCRKMEARNIIILPYFLFTGILMERMKEMAEGFKDENPGLLVEMADYFGFHPLMEDIIERRIHEAVHGQAKLNCDLCQYRLLTAHHGHDHEHHHDDHQGHAGH